MTADASVLESPAPLPLTTKLELVREIVPTYVTLRRALRQANLPKTLARARGELGAGSGNGRALSYFPARRLGRAVERTLGPIPAESRCLMHSLVLIQLLARRGTPGKLVIGVKAGGAFGAHAWVELDGLPLLPGTDGSFQRLVEL